MLFGYCEVEATALAGRGGNPDLAAVTFDNFFALCKPDTRTPVFVPRVKSAERLENDSDPFVVHSNSVIRDGETPEFLKFLHPHVNPRTYTIQLEL